MDEHIVDSLEAAHNVSALGLTSVSVKLNECYPAKDARKLLGVLKEKMETDSWFVSRDSLTQLEDLAVACEALKEADEDIVGVTDGATADLLVSSRSPSDVPVDNASRRAMVLRAIGLPSGSMPPRRFTTENYDLVVVAYDRLQQQILQSREDLESIRAHLRDVWRPWAEDRLNARAPLGEPFFDD